jgi:CubicO group peptidase (beta-lactamase class C family)
MIIHKGEIIFREAFGLADLDTKRPFTTDAMCYVASATKPHTATMIVMLADQGKLSLDEPVDKYLPQFKSLGIRDKGPASRAPTIKECLSHTTGFPGNKAIKSGAFTFNQGALGRAGHPLRLRAVRLHDCRPGGRSGHRQGLRNADERSAL